MNHSPLKLNVVHSKIKEFICGTYSPPSIYFLSILNHKTAFKLPPWPYVAVRGAESSLSSLSQNNVLNLRIRIVTKKRSRNTGTKQTEAVGEACFLTEISREKIVRSLFAILFKYRHRLSFKLGNQIATNIFSNKPSALQTCY